MRGGPPNEVGSTSAGGYREIRWGSANQVGPPMKVKSSQVNAALELPGAPALRAKRPRRVRRNGQAKVEAGVSGTRAVMRCYVRPGGSRFPKQPPIDM